MKKNFYLVLLLIINNTISICDNTALKVGYLTTWKAKCGIAVYTEHLYNALISKGYTPIIYDIFKTKREDLLSKIKKDQLDIINIQFEPSLYKNAVSLCDLILAIKKLNTKVILIINNEPKCANLLAYLADQIIYHKLPTLTDSSKITIIPLGIPTFKPTNTKVNLRQKYGFSNHDKIISTTGFMLKWKEYSEVLEAMAPFIKADQRYKIQLLTSFNDVSAKESLQESYKIKQVIAKHALEDQVIHITDFLSQQELSERLWISDIGYMWSNENTCASSASAREFISVQLPFVVTDSTHFQDLSTGLVKTDKDRKIFINTIFETLNNPTRIKVLYNELNDIYNNLNYNNLVIKHLEVFNKVLKS